MKIKEVITEVEKIAPPELALEWDNVGLLVGDSRVGVKNILMTIDVTKAVVAEAQKNKAELILSYHPVIWDGLKSVTADGDGSIVYDLVRSGIAVYSMHTSVDIALGGVNDALAEMVGIVDAEPIGDYVTNPADENFKLIVFVPIDSVNKVSEAVFAAGAGAIGNYSDCGFQSEGVGSFKPLKGSKPKIGSRGKVEKVAEIRFVTIVSAGNIGAVVEVMLKAHPYEVPAYDVIKLAQARNRYGLGRIGRISEPIELDKILEQIRKTTGAEVAGIVGREKRLIKSAAVCAGSCSKIINNVIAAGVDLYVTGELKHHQALAAQEAGVTAVCLSHSVSERFILKKLAKDLQKCLKTVKIRTSKQDKDPFNWKSI